MTRTLVPNAARLLLCAVVVAGCDGAGRANGEHPEADARSDADGGATDVAESDGRATDSENSDVAADGSGVSVPPVELVVVSFNSGSGVRPPSEGNDGWGPEQQQIGDDWYGNGLAWKAVVEDTRRYLAALAPDLVAFQEIFWPGDCAEIPAEHHAGFVCEDDPPATTTVAAMVLGDGWQIACNPGSPDKCVGIRRTFGTFRDCDSDMCLEGMRGSPVEGCGRGARVAAATVDLTGGRGSFNVVNLHGTSGFEVADKDCRVREIDRVFVGEDGQQALVGDGPDLVVGDFNTDPGRLASSDPSAARWQDFAGADRPFRYHTAVGDEATPTYLLLNIDHVVSDAMVGTCRHGGLDGEPSPTELVYFDHRPVVCALRLER